MADVLKVFLDDKANKKAGSVLEQERKRLDRAAAAQARAEKSAANAPGTFLRKREGNLAISNTIGFLSREEFTGRAGTAVRGVAAGNFVAAMLALVTIEQAGQIIVAGLRGATAKEQLNSILDTLVPSLLRSTIPTIIAEVLGTRTDKFVTLAGLDALLNEKNEQERRKSDPFFRRAMVRRAAWRQLK